MLPGKCFGAKHVVVAGDVTAGSIVIPAPDTLHCAGALVQLRTTAGVIKTWDGATVVDADGVTVDNTGAADFAATDEFTVIMFGA